jgi:hypothetical protein
MMRMGYLHRLRVSELCDLRWDQVNFKDATLLVKRLKGGRNSLLRQVPQRPTTGWRPPSRLRPYRCHRQLLVEPSPNVYVQNYLSPVSSPSISVPNAASSAAGPTFSGTRSPSMDSMVRPCISAQQPAA